MDEPVESRRYERAGLDVVPSVERLQEFYAEETTYLSMFLVLGALGLAVGSLYVKARPPHTIPQLPKMKLTKQF